MWPSFLSFLLLLTSHVSLASCLGPFPLIPIRFKHQFPHSTRPFKAWLNALPFLNQLFLLSSMPVLVSLFLKMEWTPKTSLWAVRYFLPAFLLHLFIYFKCIMTSLEKHIGCKYYVVFQFVHVVLKQRLQILLYSKLLLFSPIS